MVPAFIPVPGAGSPLTRVTRWFTGNPDTSSQAALLWVLAIAVEKQIPLVDVLDAFAEESDHRWRYKVSDLALLLNEGMPLPEAMKAVPGLFPEGGILAARIGAESGTLPQTLRAAAAELTEQLEQHTGFNPMQILVYLISIMLISGLVVSFIMIWIIPKFMRIFEDFGTSLPPMTLALIGLSDWVVRYWYVMFSPLFFILVVMLAWKFGYSVDYLPVGKTLPSRLFPRLYFAGVLRAAGIVIDAGRPLTGVVETIANHYPYKSIYKPFSLTLDVLEAGGDPWQSMLEQRLLNSRELSVIESAGRAGNLGWALKQVGREMQRRQVHRLEIVVEFIRPTVILLMAGIIGFIVISLFLPLLKLLVDLS